MTKKSTYKNKQGSLPGKHKLELLFNTSNLWTTKDIQLYFNYPYYKAAEVKKAVSEIYGTNARNKRAVSPQDVFKYLGIDLKKEIENIRFLIEMENQRHANQK